MHTYQKWYDFKKERESLRGIREFSVPKPYAYGEYFIRLAYSDRAKGLTYDITKRKIIGTW